MAKAFSDDDAAVRLTVIELLGAMPHDDARKELESYAKKARRQLAKDVDTHVVLIRAIGRHRSPESLDRLATGAVAVADSRLRRARIFAVGYQ